MVKDMTLKVTRDRTIVEQIYELTKYQMQKNVQYYRIPPGGGLTYETDGDARRLA